MRMSGVEPGLDKETPRHVAFSITDDRALVACRIAFDALQALSDAPDGNAMVLFTEHQDRIVDAAIAKYEREGAPGGMVTLARDDVRS